MTDNVARMTTQQKLDCLLKHLDGLIASQGDGAYLSEQDVDTLKAQCQFANRKEIGFYIRSLAERGLVKSECAGDNTILGARITIDGYCELDTLRS